VVRPDGYRYLSGGGGSFLQQLVVRLLLALGPRGVVLLIADGARFLRAFFTELLARLPAKTMILDWYHLDQKCTEQCSPICRGKQAKRQLLVRLYRG